MPIIIFAAAIVLFAGALLVTVLFSAVLIDISFVGHDFASTRLAAKTVSLIVKKHHKENGIVYDFGSCRGEFILKLLKYCPTLHAFGIDSSRFRILFSKFKSRLLNRPVIFLRGDVFEADISKADIVYIYLDQSLMPALQEKMRKELKPGSLVILNTQHFPSWQPAQTYIVHPKKPDYEKLSVYQV